MKILSDSAITRSDLDDAVQAQDKKIKFLQIQILASLAMNVALIITLLTL